MQTENNSQNNNEYPKDNDQDFANNAKQVEFGESTEQQAADQRILQLEQALAEAKDRYLRTVAESENVRRRNERERSDLIKYAAEGIVKDLLPVLDALDTALQQPPPSHPNQPGLEGADKVHVSEGFRLIHKQFLEVLRKHGLDVVDVRDVPFDPNVHQAIQMIPTTGATEQKVAAVFAKGYAIHGRVVRPAMVSVSVPEN